MNLKNLSSESITKFGKFVCECDCGKTHTFKTDNIYFESGAIDKISEALSFAAPPSALIGIITDAETKNILERTVEKKVSAAGYKVISHIFENTPVQSAYECAKVNFPEETRAILGIGGQSVSDISKYIAKSMNIPCVLFPTHPSCANALTEFSFLVYGGTEHIFKTAAPKCVLVDTDIISQSASSFTAAAFGQLCSKLTALYDWYFAHIVNGESFCKTIYLEGYNIISSCIEKTEKMVKEGAKPAAFLAEQNLKFSALCLLSGNLRILSGGDSQSAHALELLLKHEERDAKLRGENEFLLSRVLIKVYKQILKSKTEFFAPPPDNNLRLSLLTEFFGLDEIKAAQKIRPLANETDVKLSSYRLAEYRTELLEQLTSIELLLESAWKTFKRLYEDDGFSLVNYLDASDISLCIALAPDLKEKYTMLTYMKNAGLLESYLT